MFNKVHTSALSTTEEYIHDKGNACQFDFGQRQQTKRQEQRQWHQNRQVIPQHQPQQMSMVPDC